MRGPVVVVVGGIGDARGILEGQLGVAISTNFFTERGIPDTVLHCRLTSLCCADAGTPRGGASARAARKGHQRCLKYGEPGSRLIWSGLRPGDQLSLAFPVPSWLELEKLGPQLGRHMAKSELLPETLIFVSDDCRGEANQLPSFGFREGSRLRPTRKIGRSYNNYCVWKGSRLTAAEAILNSVHGKLVFGRRVRVLSEALANQLPPNAKVLDVGTGDGSIAALIMKRRSDVAIEGVDVFLRAKTRIPVTTFDGRQLPFSDNAFDCVMFVDVLHHTSDPASLVREAARVASRAVLIKDHLLQGLLAGSTLRLMDWVGNRGHKVVLPYNYLPRARWDEIFKEADLTVDHWIHRVGLYPLLAGWVFDRRLHFVARLIKHSMQKRAGGDP